MKPRSGESWPNVSSAIGTIGTGRLEPALYTGRFAPSPTGPLHFGSLLAAIASYLQARYCEGRWLVRIEDIDPPRQQAGATDLILTAMERYGFEWDGPVSYQSESRDAHDAALEWLLDEGLAYRCGCTRRKLADERQGPLGTIYPGYCRSGTDADETAIRVRTTAEPIRFEDELQGEHTQYLETESGDFVIRRRDGLMAYQLAVVVDDQLQGITEVVRGIDLIDSTPRQIWLQRLLGYAEPRYMHIPVATNAKGQKLSKSHGAGGVSMDQIELTLVAALSVLGQEPPAGLENASIADIWTWARLNWRAERLAGQKNIPVAHISLSNAENP